MPQKKLSQLLDLEELQRKRTFKDKAEYIIDGWIRAKPADYAAFVRICEHERSKLLKETGMSAGKQFAYTGQIPTEIYIVMHRLDPQFGHRPELVSMVQNMIMPKNTLPDLKSSTQFNDFSMYEETDGRHAKANYAAEDPSFYLPDREEREEERTDSAQEPRADTGAP